MFRFTIRELVLVTVIVAMGVGWWADRRTWHEAETTFKRPREHSTFTKRLTPRAPCRLCFQTGGSIPRHYLTASRNSLCVAHVPLQTPHAVDPAGGLAATVVDRLGEVRSLEGGQERQKQAKIWTIFDGDTAGWTYSPLSPNPFFAPPGSELPTAPPSVAVPEEPRE